jgi:hypothetical protein
MQDSEVVVDTEKNLDKDESTVYLDTDESLACIDTVESKLKKDTVKSSLISDKTIILSTADLLLFENITNFVNDVAGCFDSRKNILLYNRLLEKTTFQHKQSILTHNATFKKFYFDNKEAILTKKKDDIKTVIKYSTKLFIDVASLLNASPQKEVENAIWGHMLKIGSIIDPESRARSILKDSAKNGGMEEKFINGMFEKIQGLELKEDEVSANPMGGMQSGDFDISKMMGMVTGMMSTMNSDTNPETKSIN